MTTSFFNPVVQFSKLNMSTGKVTNKGPTISQIDQPAHTIGTCGTLIEIEPIKFRRIENDWDLELRGPIRLEDIDVTQPSRR